MCVSRAGSVRRAFLVFASLSSIFAARPAHAQLTNGLPPSGLIIHVPADQPTIQAGIDAAADGDLVLVSAGTYTGPGNRDIGFRGKRITLRALNGVHPVVIDCQGSSDDPHRAFFFHGGEDAATVVEGFTLANGFAGPLSRLGGAVLCLQASPTLRDCTVQNSQAPGDSGGGIACVDAAPTIVRCTFQGNDAYIGGALFLRGSSADLIRCSFETNTGHLGCAVYCEDSSPRFTKCEFRGNQGDLLFGSAQGGGLYCTRSAPLVRDCLFRENNGGDGGALYCEGSTPRIENCSLEANVGNSGGAIYCTGSSAHVEGTRLTGNQASNGGAVLLLQSSNATFLTCVFEANVAGNLQGGYGLGGAVYCQDSSPLFELDSFLSNRAIGQSLGPAGGALYLRFAAPTLHKNLFKGNEAFADPSYSVDAFSRGGAICLENSSPVLGAPAGGENIFAENRALFGADLFIQGGGPTVNARSNTFTIFPPTPYYLSPLAGFDVSGGSGLHPTITTDVTVSPVGVDAEGAPGPLRTLRFALSRMAPSAQNPLTIHLEPGTYSASTTGESFPVQMVDHVRLIGSGADSSILDAAGAERVILCNGVAGVEISGLEITGGVAGTGGGILCRAASPTIRANRIEGNAGIWGGGIACTEGAAPQVTENEILNNTTLDSPYFAKLGGGIYCSASSPLLARNVIAGNRSLDYGGGIACDRGSNPVLRNDTISGNEARLYGGGSVVWNNSHPTIQNCISWSNTAGGDAEISLCCGSTAAADYSDVAGGWAGTNNLALDPRFVDAAGGDFHLMSDSPCIDAGDPATVHDPDGTVADMGALPFFQAAVRTPSGPRLTRATRP